MNFMNKVCKSTILLCSATQPPFDKAKRRLRFSEENNPSITPYIEAPKRYEIINKLAQRGFTLPELAEFIRKKHNQSTLVILNTKGVVKALYKELKNLGLPVLHLSNNMYSTHRDDTIEEIRERLKINEPVVCVSSNLIEAGVDISFECVIRDIAGLDSIYQAAGRCNRHGEYAEVKNVYVVNIKDERLERLPDIKIGAEKTTQLFSDNNLDINKYYDLYFGDDGIENKMDYPLKESGTLYGLLSDNKNGCDAYKWRRDEHDNIKPPVLRQAIRSAAEEFYVIEKGRVDVIVYCEESSILLRNYRQIDNKSDNYIDYIKKKKKKRKILRGLGKYSISLYKHEIDYFNERGAIDYSNYEGLTVLVEGFYDDNFGLNVDGKHPFTSC
jgi:CRISPR-associated endonuclease/helicase Cas3